MKCPVCDDADLLMSECQGIEIDYCPMYRGGWLDHGGLDKIIERSPGTPARSVAPPQGAHRGRPPMVIMKKKSRLFGDLFDF
jgi:hypothetical protein